LIGLISLLIDYLGVVVLASCNSDDSNQIQVIRDFLGINNIFGKLHKTQIKLEE
jgi:hypothetical protein